AAVISNYMLGAKSGWDRGFDVFDDDLEDQEQVRNWPERIAENATDRSLELLKRYHKDPLFMWIHYQDPHGPYTPPGGFAAEFRDPGQKPRRLPVNQSLSGQGGIPSYQKLDDNVDYYDYVARYDGEIKYFDQNFHRLIEGLKELGLYDQALIIFTADHGEGMGENNYYFAHGENLHRSLLHVPLMVKYGGDLLGRRSDYVQHLDVVPTILKFLGLETDAPYRGFDLLAEPPGPREIFAEMNSPIAKDRVSYSLINNKCKVIYAPLSKRVQLFDLSRDPQETNDLAEEAQYRQQGLELLAQMNRISREDRLNLGIVNQSVPLSEAEKEKLRSLGYIR
ncbi:sulfatase, partial [Planctomycetota bacterium]